MMIRLIALLLVIGIPQLTQGDSFDESVIHALQKHEPVISHIFLRTTSPINEKYSILAVYATPSSNCDLFPSHRVGVFIVDHQKSRIEFPLEVRPAKRGCDETPRILSVDQRSSVISFESGYGELARTRYQYDLLSKKVIAISKVPAEDIKSVSNQDSGNQKPEVTLSDLAKQDLALLESFPLARPKEAFDKASKMSCRVKKAVAYPTLCEACRLELGMRTFELEFHKLPDENVCKLQMLSFQPLAGDSSIIAVMSEKFGQPGKMEKNYLWEKGDLHVEYVLEQRRLHITATQAMAAISKASQTAVANSFGGTLGNTFSFQMWEAEVRTKYEMALVKSPDKDSAQAKAFSGINRPGICKGGYEFKQAIEAGENYLAKNNATGLARTLACYYLALAYETAWYISTPDRIPEFYDPKDYLTQHEGYKTGALKYYEILKKELPEFRAHIDKTIAAIKKGEDTQQTIYACIPEGMH